MPDYRLFNTILAGGLYNAAEEPFFSWSGCSACRERTGERLGATVYEVRGFLSLADAKENNYYVMQICAGCLCAYANGDQFPEEVRS